MLGKVNMILDTTVFIDLFRDQKIARDFFLRTFSSLRTSRVVVMELIYGLKVKKDIRLLLKQLTAFHIEIIEIDEAISREADKLFEAYFHSHGLGVMDAFVAATALVKQEELVTHNIKHYRFIKELKIVIPY